MSNDHAKSSIITFHDENELILIIIIAFDVVLTPNWSQQTNVPLQVYLKCNKGLKYRNKYKNSYDLPIFGPK